MGFNKIAKKVWGAIVPVNTLNQAPRSSLPLAPPYVKDDADPPSKKRRLDEEEDKDDETATDDQNEDVGYPTLQAQFTLDMAAGMAPPERRNSLNSTRSASRAQRAPSVQSTGRISSHRPASVHSLSRSSTQNNVEEFRSVERLVKPPTNKRPRRKKPDNSALNPESIDDSEEDAKPVLPESNGRPDRKHDAQQDHDVTHYGQRFAKPRTERANEAGISAAKRKSSQTLMGPIAKHSRNSSPDPLLEGLENKGPERLKKRSFASNSESIRGALSPSFSSKRIPQNPRHTRTDSADKIFNILSSPVRSNLRKGLKLKMAVSNPYSYNHETCEPKCLLMVGNVSTILLPMPLQGGSIQDFLSEYGYLQVNLNKTHTIKFDKTNLAVRVDRSTDQAAPVPARLYLVFDGAEDFAGFEKWATMKREPSVHLSIQYENGDKLIKCVNNLLEKATEEKMVQGSDDVQERTAPDVQWMARSRARRSKLLSQNNTSKPDLRRTRYLANSAEIIDDDDLANTIPESPQPSVSRTTRKRFAVRSESPPPLKLWTNENPDWAEKHWRNSLVFPPQGKNRAIVDANDIERLDEGEFLNDNLIIFYLRYLQDKLEKDKPHVAERIHFHNTFFYDKLKPTRSGAGIKYDGIKSWTTKVDLFKKDFIVVPINEYQHWYVAIIYNPSKLDPSQEASSAAAKPVALDLTTPEKPGKEVSTTIDNPTTNPEPDVEMQDGAKVVETELRRMSIESAKGDADADADAPRRDTTSQHEDEQAKGAEKDIYDVDAGTEVQQGSSPSTSANRKAKKTSLGSKKHHDPNQPKIITLDSLGSAHSPACTHLRHYLIAELKDKKGIEIPDPGALGMTAKKIPLQENHCDCGLYLLGYVRHFLEDPDAFVHGLLHYDEPTWSFVSSNMRHDIRELIFQLQAEQQKREDVEQEAKKQKKRQAAEEKRNRNGPTSSASDPKEPLEISSSAATQGTQASHVEDGVVPGKPTKHDAIDASSMLQPGRVTQSIEMDEVISVAGSSQKTSPESRAMTGTNGETGEPCNASMSMPGTFPVGQQIVSPAPARSGSNDTQKGFMRGLLSPDSRGHTSDNPVEVHDEADNSPSLTKELEENLAQAKSPSARRTPRKQNSRPNTESRQHSVEVHETLQSPRTNIGVFISSRGSREHCTATKRASSQTAETGQTSKYFSGAASQPQEETLTAVKYMGQRNRSEDQEAIIVD
ncbi:hypothetical protein E8E14_008544 [Neopestalotiopsis sp. 37M]|nr:hypothetical protein E8E14_008544 [Neopestalotiopsis sp. 37M]